MNKSVTKYIFPYNSFHAEHNGDIYFHVQQLLRKLDGIIQPHVSLFIPPPSPVLSQYIPFYEVRRNIKMADRNLQNLHIFAKFLNFADLKTKCIFVISVTV